MDIENIKRRLLVKYPFFGGIVALSNFVLDESIETAGTDGQNIYYNPDFIDLLKEDEKVFVFAHEICHIAFNHVLRSEGKNKEIWNIATDSVINALLKKDGFSIVEGGVDIEYAIDYDAEGMYQKLLNENNENEKQKNNSFQNQSSSSSLKDKSNNQGKSNNQDSKNNQSNSDTSFNSKEELQSNNLDVGHDTHSMWDKAILKKIQDQKSQSSNEDNKQEKLEEEIKKLTKFGENKAFKQNKIERKKRLEELRSALASKSHGYGNDTNKDKIYIYDIGISNPLFDWRLLLKEAVKYDFDWSYQNAEIENGVLMAHLEDIKKSETEIILDTSGSINEILLRNFLRECKNILQISNIKVGCFDTHFYGFTEIKKGTDIDNLPFYGGGGTNFDVAISAFTKRVENKIIFTDGEARMPKESIDAIWIVFGGKKINPPGGRVIYIDDKQLDKLCNYEIKTRHI